MVLKKRTSKQMRFLSITSSLESKMKQNQSHVGIHNRG
ncbi:hypothetical protein AALP_AA7G173900 [Arabis alpina]|uniref:Uncharacterized protein n=1 Tax=Arabis alpina TaxID=50452 RepID=A0A087GIP8_ARAAL|nr:hypothetical protein AALP_AA7G173900 [Arabis alpina]